jgi:Nucleotidyl transferase AbiEii toxin, Type IV TA system
MRAHRRMAVVHTLRMEPDTIRALFAALRDENVDYVLVGALAMDVLGIGRLTEDIDLFVRPTPDNVDRLRRALHRVWSDPSIDEITAADLAGDFPAVQYVAPDGTPIDILSRLGDAFTFADIEATIYSYGDVDVKVATPETLYRMKRDTVRLQDKADAQVLREKFGLKD